MSDETERTLRSRGREAAYSLAAGAAAMAATEAEGQIVWSTPQNIAIEQRFSQVLNLDGDYYYDIRLKNYAFTGGPYQGATVIYEPGRTVQFRENELNYSRALQVGDLIDSLGVATGGPDTSLSYGANNPNAEFNNADSAYLGLAFPIDAVNHFGWIRVTIDNAAGVFVVRDWAYNITPGAPIAAGQRADFNGDGSTDAADYTIWRDTLGTTRVDDEFILADVDLSNQVDQADYDIWAEDFGLSTAEASPAAVPEPISLGLLAAGAAGVATMRRLRAADRRTTTTGTPAVS